MMYKHISEKLKKLGLSISENSFVGLAESCLKKKTPFLQGVEQLLQIEQQEREFNNMSKRLKSAKLAEIKMLKDFDWNHPKLINKALFEHLMTLDFVTKRQNVLFRGPSGLGKTVLSCHLGLIAIEKGYSVRFCTLSEILADLLKQDSIPALQRRVKIFTRPDVLIIDEIGYLPCNSQAADLFFNLMSARHEKKSTIITTNMSFKNWGVLFEGASCILPLVDRFAQHCHIMDIDGQSWRNKHSLSDQIKAQ